MSYRRKQNVILFVLLLTFLSSCNAPIESPAPQFPTFVLVTQDPNASPTPTPFQPSADGGDVAASFTPAPIVALTSTATITQQPTFTFTPPPTQPLANTTAPQPTVPSAPSSARTNYILY